MPVAHGFSASTGGGSTAGEVQTSNWNSQHSGTTQTSAAVLEVLTRNNPTSNSNSTAVLNFINYSVPARSLGINRMLRWTGWGLLRRGTTATAPTFITQMSHAGTSRWKDTYSNDNVLTTDPVQWRAEFMVSALGSSGTRCLSGKVIYSSQAVGTFGLGDVTVAGAGSVRSMNAVGSSDTFTITTGAAEVFQVGFNWVNANSSRLTNFHYGVLELV